MYIFYIEESGLSGLNKIYSAMGIPDVLWQRLLNELISSRRDLKNTYGIKARKELHAFKLINGRGNYGDRKFTQQELVDIYRRALAPIADYPEIRIMNAIGPDRRSETILEYLINRIEKFLTVNNDYGLLIFDNGENKKILRKIRMMRRHNQIGRAHV